MQRLWRYCNVLRDDALSYGDYLEQLTYLLSLMADEQTRPPFSRPGSSPRGSWLTLDADVMGDPYEGLLEKNAENVKSGAGQLLHPALLDPGNRRGDAPRDGMRSRWGSRTRPSGASRR